MKQLERQLQHATQMREAVEEENRGVSKEIERLRRELREEQKKTEQHFQQASRVEAEKRALKQKSKLYDERLKTFNETLDIRKQSTVALESELLSAKQRIEGLTEETRRLQQEQQHYRGIDDENVKLRQENYLLADKIREERTAIGRHEGRAQDLLQELNTLRGQHEQLKSKLSLLRDFDTSFAEK